MGDNVSQLSAPATVLRTGKPPADSPLEGMNGERIPPMSAIDFGPVSSTALRGFSEKCKFMSCDWEQHVACRGTTGAIERARARIAPDSERVPDGHVYRGSVDKITSPIPGGGRPVQVEAWHWPEESPPNEAHTHLVLRETLTKPERNAARNHVQLALRLAT